MIYDTKNIRNVVLLGHPGCGKTTLAETMLFEAGAISRRGSVLEKNTVIMPFYIEVTINREFLKKFCVIMA